MFGIDFLIALFGGIVLTFVVAYYSRRNPWVVAGVVGAGAYLLLDLALYANGLAASVNGPLGFPLFLDFSPLLAPVGAWLQSLGPSGSAVALALILGSLSSIPLWAKPLNEWLDKVA